MDEVVVYVVGFSLTIIGMLGGSLFWLGRKFAQIEHKFAEMDKRFAEVDKRFVEVQNNFSSLGVAVGSIGKNVAELRDRVSSLESRVAGLEKGVAELNNRVSSLETKLEAMERDMAELRGRLASLEDRFMDFERRFSSFADVVRSSVVAVNSMSAEFFGLKGLLSRDEVDFLVREFVRLTAGIRANPITKEELEFIKSVAAKGDVDKITVEELEKVAEICKKWWWEEGSEVAYKLFLYAIMIRAYKLYGEKREKRGNKTPNEGQAADAGREA